MLLFVITSLLYSINVKCTRQNVNVDCRLVDALPNDKKIINFAAGGGNWIYYMGIAKFLQLNYNLDNVNLVGTSAGCLAATMLANKINIDECLSDVLVKDLLIIQKQCWGPMNFFCTYCIANTQKYYNTLSELDNGNNNRLFLAVSEINGFRLKKRYFTGGSLKSVNICGYVSAWIPFITAPLFRPFFRINNCYYLDGYLSGFRDYTNKRDMFVIHPNVFRRQPLWKYWLWLDVEYNLTEYNNGYEDAKANKKKIDDYISNNI